MLWSDAGCIKIQHSERIHKLCLQYPLKSGIWQACRKRQRHKYVTRQLCAAYIKVTVVRGCFTHSQTSPRQIPTGINLEAKVVQAKLIDRAAIEAVKLYQLSHVNMGPFV